MIFSGDALNTSALRTWEFSHQPLRPLRSIVLPKLLFTPFLFALKWLSAERELFTLTGYLVLLSSRLVMLFLSFWIDYCVYKICGLIGGRCQTAALLLASSYVTLTFQIHSFSNSIETVLLITELFIIVSLVQRKVTFSLDRDSQLAMIRDLEKSFETKKMKLDPIYNLHKLAYGVRNRGKASGKAAQEILNQAEQSQRELELERQLIELVKKDMDIPETTPWIGIVVLSVINMLGFFNRPTFVIFVIGPLLWWMYVMGLSKLRYKQLTVFVVSSFITFVTIVLADNYYYTPKFSIATVWSIISKKEFYKLCTNYLKITPLNFILYNLESRNLAQHGLHPQYLHALVNMPLLYGPLVAMFLYIIFSQISFYVFANHRKEVSSNSSQHKSDTSKKKPGTSASNCDSNSTDLVVENKMQNDMKILLPIFVAIPLLGLSLFPHQEARFLIPLLPLVVLATVIWFKQGLGKPFWVSFVTFNIPLCIIFGLFHQGGVVPCLLHLQTITHSQTSQATAPLRINIVFSHTYMPPHHLLLISKEENVKVHDLMGQKMDKVCNELKHILRKFDSADELTYLVLPGNVLNEFTQTCGKYIQLNSLHSFFPHLSLDDLSMFENVVDITNFYKFLSLNLFVVKFISED